VADLLGWKLEAGSWILDTGCWMLDAEGSAIRNPQSAIRNPQSAIRRLSPLPGPCQDYGRRLALRPPHVAPGHLALLGLGAAWCSVYNTHQKLATDRKAV
jgi:hypothetical protein